MTANEFIRNNLILEGLDDKLAVAAVDAIRLWLTSRVEELRAEGKHEDAVWYHQIRNELRT